MAKTEAIMASVTTHQHAFGDQRFVVLAEAAGLANHYEALGRMEYLWSRCTALRTDRPGLKVLRVFLGKNAAEAILEADLGELMDDGEIRVKGCEERHGWFADAAPRGAKGGAVRAANAPRVGGRFVREQHPNEPGAPSADDPPPGEPDDPTPDHQRPPASHQQTAFAGELLVPATSDHHTKYKDQDQIKDPKNGERERTTARAPARGAPAPSPIPLPTGWEPQQTPALAAAIKTLPVGATFEKSLARFKAVRRSKGATSCDWDEDLLGWLANEHPKPAYSGASSRAPPIATGPSINHEHLRNLDEIAARADVRPGDAAAAMSALKSLLTLPARKAKSA